MTPFLRPAAARLTTLIAVGTLAGCASMLSYSDDSRAQGIRDLRANQYDEAAGAFSDAVRQNPRDYQSHYYLGVLYDRKKEYTNALAHFKTSLDVQPVTTEGLHDEAFRIKTLTAQADTMAKVIGNDAAINDLEAKAGASTTGEESYQLGRIYAGRGDADSAITAYNRAASQAPDKFYIVKASTLR